MLAAVAFIGIIVIVAVLNRFDRDGLALRWRMGRVPESPVAKVCANQRVKVAGQVRRGWPIRVEEHSIRDGALVCVLGNASYRTDAEATSTTEVVLTCPDDAPLLLRVQTSTFG